MQTKLERPLLLRGNVVQPDGTAHDRYVLVRDGVIRSVTRRRPPRSDEAVYLETGRNDWIFPGLIDLHTHTSSNLLPLWDPGRLFGNRFEWRGDPQYKKEVGKFFRDWKAAPGWQLKAAFAELQAIAGGTTLLQEDWDLDGVLVEGEGQVLCRGTGSPRDLGLSESETVLSIIDFFYPDRDTDPWTPKATEKLTAYTEQRGRLRACLVHLAEGRPGVLTRPDAYTRAEFEAFLRHPAMQDAARVRDSRLALIHCCGVDTENPEHLEFLRRREIGVVWSPVSNLLLYGETPDVEALVRDGILVGLGSDWSPSGSKHVWDEAKFARFYFDALGANVSDVQIFQMVTTNAAQLLGVDTVGRIAPGRFGDFFILRSPRETDNPMEVFFGVEDRHVRAVLIGGRPIYGHRELLSRFGLELQPLPQEEGTAVRDKAVHLPGMDLARAIREVEDLMKAEKDRKRSNLLVSSDTPYRNRMRRLRQEVLEWGWRVRQQRHQKWKASLASSTCVPPNAARVWSGFRLEHLSADRFRDTLADTFIPSTVRFAAPLGLNSYLLAVLPDDKPENVPDEVALVYYESQDVYDASRQTLGGRVYAKLHGIAFAWPASWSDFPTLLQDGVGEATPYYLFPDPTDWQQGVTRLLVGTRPADQEDGAFRRALYEFVDGLRDTRPPGLNNVVFSVKEGCLVFWEHWRNATAATASRLGDLAQQVDAVLLREAEPLLLEPRLTRDCKATEELAGGRCFNTIFSRRAQNA